MSPSTITLIFLAFAIVSFILEKIPLGLTATIVAIGLNLTGVLSTSDTFAGYVNSNVILCVGMFVVGQALFETGMANKIGSLVTRFAKSERLLIVAVMTIVGIMSGFLSNAGTAAVLIPAGCAVVAATEVLKIKEHHWDELGMPETLWCSEVKEFGPLIVSIDPDGRNLFEEQKVLYNQRKEAVKQTIYPQVQFIK